MRLLYAHNTERLNCLVISQITINALIYQNVLRLNFFFFFFNKSGENEN